MERYLGIILLIALTFFAKSFWQTPLVLADSTPTPSQNLPVNQPVTTVSSFTEKTETETAAIPKKTVYQDDPETEAGTDTVLDEGIDGKTIKTVKITYAKDGEEFSKETISVETIPAKDKKISRGTKIVWRSLDTADAGSIQYWKRLHVWATQYDSHCLGCDEWTATGMHQGKGVIAVDPKVIPLGTKLYIPGYGPAVAGDVGGGVKGNMIDVGFPDAHTSGWQSHGLDVYIMTN